MNYSDMIRAVFDGCIEDPAYIVGVQQALDEGLAALCGFGPRKKAVEGPPPAFPDADAITLVQTSIFDNWPAGKPVKGVPSRYGLAVEVWTKDPDQIVIQKGRKPNYDFKSSSALMDGLNLKRQVRDLRRKQRKTPINPKYLDHLDETADAIMGTSFHVAMINTSITDTNSGYDLGRYYHDFQSIIVDMEGGNVKFATMLLGQNDSMITLAPFVQEDAGGNGLARNVIAQSRHDIMDSLGSWGTNDQSHVDG